MKGLLSHTAPVLRTIPIAILVLLNRGSFGKAPDNRRDEVATHRSVTGMAVPRLQSSKSLDGWQRAIDDGASSRLGQNFGPVRETVSPPDRTRRESRSATLLKSVPHFARCSEEAVSP